MLRDRRMAGRNIERAALGRARKQRKSAATRADDNAPDVVTYGERDDVMRFADAVAARRGLDAAWIRGALAQARFVPSVARYIMPAAERRGEELGGLSGAFRGAGSHQGRHRLLAGQPGLAREGRGALRRAARDRCRHRRRGDRSSAGRWATSASSTRWPRSPSTFPAAASDRSAFFQDELENWFVLCRSEDVEPLAWKSSYAGAIGMAQFMPSSFNKYAVDLDGDGHVDLHRSSADVIGSVANYLAEFGWSAACQCASTCDRQPMRRSLGAARPRHRAHLQRGRDDRTRRVLPPDARGNGKRAGARRAAERRRRADLFAGTTNFYALTRYNWSSYYAMAVVDLGTAIASALRAEPRLAHL